MQKLVVPALKQPTGEPFLYVSESAFNGDVGSDVDH